MLKLITSVSFAGKPSHTNAHGSDLDFVNLGDMARKPKSLRSSPLTSGVTWRQLYNCPERQGPMMDDNTHLAGI